MHRYYGNIDILLNGLRDNTCNAFQIIWKLYQPKWILNAADGHTRACCIHTYIYIFYIYIFWNFNQPLYDQLVSRQTRYWIKQTLFALVQNYDSQATIAITAIDVNTLEIRGLSCIVGRKKKWERERERKEQLLSGGGRKVEEGSNTGTDNRYFFIMTTQGNYSASW